MKFLAGTINAVVLAAMAAVGAYQIKEAQALATTKFFSDEDMYCLQQNVYFESRNQSDLGQSAVAWVTLNRLVHKNYPNTICKVVWQRKQFSWTHDGKSDEPGTNILEQRAWEKAGRIAQKVVSRWNHGEEGPVGNATMFHADWMSPYWKGSYDRVTKIDSHIFYE